MSTTEIDPLSLTEPVNTLSVCKRSRDGGIIRSGFSTSVEKTHVLSDSDDTLYIYGLCPILKFLWRPDMANGGGKSINMKYILQENVE